METGINVALVVLAVAAIYFAIGRFRRARMLGRASRWPKADIALFEADIAAEEWAGIALGLAALAALVTMAARL